MPGNYHREVNESSNPGNFHSREKIPQQHPQNLFPVKTQQKICMCAHIRAPKNQWWRGIQILYLNKSRNTAVQKYSITSKKSSFENLNKAKCSKCRTKGRCECCIINCILY